MDVLLTVCTYSYRTHSMSQSPDLGSRESSSKMSYSRYWLFLPKAHQHIQSSSINISPQRLCMNYHVFSLYIHFAQCNLCHSFVVFCSSEAQFLLFFSPPRSQSTNHCKKITIIHRKCPRKSLVFQLGFFLELSSSTSLESGISVWLVLWIS